MGSMKKNIIRQLTPAQFAERARLILERNQTIPAWDADDVRRLLEVGNAEGAYNRALVAAARAA